MALPLQEVFVWFAEIWFSLNYLFTFLKWKTQSKRNMVSNRAFFLTTSVWQKYVSFNFGAHPTHWKHVENICKTHPQHIENWKRIETTLKPYWANAPNLGPFDPHHSLTTNSKHLYNNIIDWLNFFPFKTTAFHNIKFSRHFIFSGCVPRCDTPLGDHIFRCVTPLLFLGGATPLRVQPQQTAWLQFPIEDIFLVEGGNQVPHQQTAPNPTWKLWSQFLVSDFVKAMAFHPAMPSQNLYFVEGGPLGAEQLHH